ncbi:uncharacterized protein [Triticum aestivum]|uniref:uncharacterized protein n=1 Tax=Triticum aestivum TaxID=4565 RepID=UPI001D022CA6|nr:uncharacterized protein LOC123107842 [Triticum aestivum]
MASTIPPWSEIPQDILGLVIDRLYSSPGHTRFSAAWSKILLAVPVAAANRRGFQHLCRRTRHSAAADRARFRAVCRSWHLAMRQHVSTTPEALPWIVMSDGSFFTHSDGGCSAPRRLPSLPENARCIGSTDEWLALDCTDAENMHTYFLHNPFSNTTVPLPELSPIIGDVSEFFEVHKVLLRSSPHDIVALMTNNSNHPIILIRPGKGVWLPKPDTTPFNLIIDIVFLEAASLRLRTLPLSVLILMTMAYRPLPLQSASSNTHPWKIVILMYGAMLMKSWRPTMVWVISTRLRTVATTMMRN